ncbi:MAG: hypothetical protein HKN78_06885 [Sphingomonadaceae bacterium]|nr:hypothetical protein [Sphingomonadaceae bacterium]
MADATRFSPSEGWNQVVRWINTHLQALIALAGVFFLLPSLVLSFFGPEFIMPAFDGNTAPEVVIAQLQAAFEPLIPWAIMVSLMQMVGQLAIMAVAATRSGATVGEAIGIGFSRFGYLILAQIVLGIGIALVFLVLSIVVGLAMAALPILGVFLALALMVFLFYLMIRFSLVSPILVTEEHRWPIALLRRSWELTRGNALTIFLFFLIVALVFMVISIVVSIVFGLVLSLAGTVGISLLAVITGIVSAAGAVIFALMPLAIWHQLSGAPGATSDVFS